MQLAEGPGKVVVLCDFNKAHKTILELLEGVVTGRSKWNFSGCIFVCVMTTKESINSEVCIKGRKWGGEGGGGEEFSNWKDLSLTKNQSLLA